MATEAVGDDVNGTTTLILVSAIFVLCMTIPGLALFYGSLVSRKNLIDTMLQSVVLTGTIPILWWVVGYSLCFDPSPNPFDSFVGGFDRTLLQFNKDSKMSGITESAYCVFQLTFGIITAAIAAGAVAERALLWPTMVIANLWLLLVYCPVCHMVWGNGLLQQWGVLDTAGGLVVETCSGVTALVLCYFVGPRSHASDDADPVRGVLHIVGAALLWVGWLAFNGGSAFTSGARASTTVLNTLLAGSAGGLSWLGCAALGSDEQGMIHLTATFHLMGGAVAGLCAATPSSGYVSPSGSMVIGLVAGVLCYFADHKLVEGFLRPRGIDDVVSVFPVHGIGGLWGTFATGLLAVESVGGVKGAIEGNWSQVRIQAASMLVVCAWSMAGTTVITYVVSHVTKLRATEEEELVGLDSRPNQTPRRRNSSVSTSSQENLASLATLKASLKTKKPFRFRMPRLFPFVLYIGFDYDLREKLCGPEPESSEAIVDPSSAASDSTGRTQEDEEEEEEEEESATSFFSV